MVGYKVFNKNDDFKNGGLWRALKERREDMRGNSQMGSGLRWGRFLMMRSILIAGLVGGCLLLVSSCASVPPGPLAEGEVRLLNIEVVQVPGSDGVKARLPFTANITFQSDGHPEIKRVCFYWSGEGPYCTNADDVEYGSPGKIKIWPRVPSALKLGSYSLECHVLYIYNGKPHASNVVSTQIYTKN